MSSENEVKFTLKVMVNKEKTKVIFAEVDSDFADILLGFLSMPLGKITSIMDNHYGSNSLVMGSLHTLRESVANLDGIHFGTEAGKQMLLNPRSLFEDECCKLKLNVYDAQPTKYLSCGDEECKHMLPRYFTMYFGTINCDECRKPLNSEIHVRGRTDDNEGVFTQKEMPFLICDDLEMLQNIPGSVIQTLNKLEIKDTVGTEIRTVTVGLNEIMDLLKLSLLSETPLSDLILHKGHTDATTIKLGTGILHPPQTKKQSILGSYSKKMTVKAMIQKSTKKFLFIQAQEDFVEFLFSLLTVPLGGVIRLFGNKTSLASVGNLYKSVSNLIGGVHLKTEDAKNGLLESLLPPMFRSRNHMFAFDEQTPKLYFCWEIDIRLCTFYSFTYPTWKYETGSEMKFKDPKGDESFVKRPGTFMITDDLTMVPSCMDTNLSFVNGLKIPLSDVGELEIGIGLDEALIILKAFLTSTSALTTGLKSVLEKRPKQGK